MNDGKEITSCYEFHPRGETRNCEENIHSYQTCQGFEPSKISVFFMSAVSSQSPTCRKPGWVQMIYTTTLVFITATGNLRLMISIWNFEAFFLKGKCEACVRIIWCENHQKKNSLVKWNVANLPSSVKWLQELPSPLNHQCLHGMGPRSSEISRSISWQHGFVVP